MMTAMVVGLLASAALAANAVAGPVKVTVARAMATSPLPGGFLGLAVEFRTIPAWVGSPSSAASLDPVLVQLIHNLNTGGRPVIRIGGESTDRSWWPVPGLAQPPGETYALTPAWGTQAHLLAQRLDARMILSTNFEADSPRISQYMADEQVAAVGSQYVAAMEIGNEPDLYTRVPWYRVLNGQDIPWYQQAGAQEFARSASYDADAFAAQYPQFLARMPRVPIAGPDADSAYWLGPYSGLVSPHGRIGMLDSHSYALQNCVTDPASPFFPSVANLLAQRAWRNVLNGTLPSVALAHRDGLQFRIDEMGSVTCQGHAGVSNTMASALWVTNALFEAAREGVDGVNLHSNPNSSNGLFDLTQSAGAWSARIHPIYDGALMFAEADPVGARELKLSSVGPSSVQTWATIGTDHLVRVLIDNEGGQRRVTVRPPPGFGQRDGVVTRLQAPSPSATGGLTVGGQSFDTTSTGVVPTPHTQTVHPGPAGYTVLAPTGSETLLTLRYRVKPGSQKPTRK